ncbi:sensor histidine kinase [Chitinibacteraceae bacterium HSL-7]
MNSIRARLFTVLIASVIGVLGIFAAYEYIGERAVLYRDAEQSELSMRERLGTVIPNALWNLDEQQLMLVLNAEMQRPEVQWLAVLSDDGRIIVATERVDDQVKVAKGPLPTDLKGMQLTYADQIIGSVRYRLSDERVSRLLRNKLIDSLLQMSVLALVLIGVLSYTFRHVVLNPLDRMRTVLDNAAHDGFAAGALDAQLPDTDELRQLGTSVEKIVGRISEELEQRRTNEAALLAAKNDIDDAYQKLQAAQHDLVQSEKLASLGSLVAGVAHEINTPVGVIMTTASLLNEDTGRFLDMVRSGALRKSELEHYCDMAQEASRLILANGERAGNLIHSFKQVAVDQSSETRRGFALKQYLDEIVTSLRPLFKHRAVTLEVDVGEDVQLDSYPGALAQIVTNLINNALAHAFGGDDSGVIRISTQVRNEQLCITFADNGRGITAEVLPQIFEPFFTTKRGQGGSGLGLNIVYNLIVKKLHGQISVESTPGVGTTFRVSFPLRTP